MPRKSAASLSVVPPAPQARPKPPNEITKQQAKLWSAIVAEMPADFFIVGSQALLTQYVRHVDTSNVIARAIDAFKPADLASNEGLRRYSRLLGTAARESAAISMLATKMRLAQSARYDSKKRLPTGPTRKPWEFVS